MGVTAECQAGELIGKIAAGMVVIENISPRFRGIQCGVDKGGVALPQYLLHGQIGEIFQLLRGELIPGPLDSDFCIFVESGIFQILPHGVIVVVAAHGGGKIQAPGDIHAACRFGIVADDIAETNILIHAALGAACQNAFKGGGIAVDIT